MLSTSAMVARLRFDRHELSGAFGDMGTDLPLLIALIATCGLDAASVCICFGVLQVATGLIYRMPMPVQPLKAMATIMLAQKLSAGTYAAGGVVIGTAMLLLTVTGLLQWLTRVVPKEVVRGIQIGLALTLMKLALGRYVFADGRAGLALASVATAILLLLRKQKRVPPPLIVIALGIVYAIVVRAPLAQALPTVGFRLPILHAPAQAEWLSGALLLALPQIPLSLGNSVMATQQTARDLFPEQPITVRKLGITYALMNLIAPWFGGVPTCHGCGGLAGFYAFGARTGGAPILYGALYLVLGFLFAPSFSEAVRIFPMPIMGVILLFETIALLAITRDIVRIRRDIVIAAIVAGVVVFVPYGYLVGMVLGTIVSMVWRRSDT